MTDEKKLQELIDNDQEYQQLVAEANAFSSSKFPTDGKTLESIKRNVSKFEKLDVEEFFTTFKCMVAWAVMMIRILDKIHGVSKYDVPKAFNIYGSAEIKYGIIYYENNPNFWIETGSPNGYLYINTPLRVYGGAGGLVNGEITFKLIEPLVLPNPAADIYIPKLLSSVMEIVINYDGKTYDQPVQVMNFDMAWLAIAINNSGMGD